MEMKSDCPLSDAFKKLALFEIKKRRKKKEKKSVATRDF